MAKLADISGAAVELQPHQDRFVLELFKAWVGNDKYRRRQLAILQLVAVGWQETEIADALGCNRHNLRRSLARAKKSFRAYAAENPDGPSEIDLSV